MDEFEELKAAIEAAGKRALAAALVAGAAFLAAAVDFFNGLGA